MTAKQLGNECAFPTGCEGDPGLTKREYFAAKAMASILLMPRGINIAQIASESVIAADALLAELAKEQP